jgi:HK97 family phage major capsid protein
MSERIAFAAKVTAEGRTIRGAVQLAGQRNRRAGEWLEVDPAALVKADASKVIGVFEHDESQLLASLQNDTLVLRRSDQGIEFEFLNLPNTTAANDALELVRGGYVTGSSFRIEDFRSTFHTDPDTGERTRRITHIGRLVDVSPVRDPFFEASSAAAFSKEFDVAETPVVEEPKAPVAEAPKAEPKVQFNAEPTLYERTLGFAKTLSDDQLKAAVAGAWSEAGEEPDPLSMQRIEAFTKEAEDRRVATAAAEDRRRELRFRRDITLGIAPKAPQEAEMFASDDYSAAFTAYLRDGRPSHMEQFAQSVAGSGAEGGFTVPDGFLNRITTRLKAFGGIAGVADEITTTTGESLRWPSNDDTTNSAAIAAEGVAGTAGADLTFGSIELGAFSYDANGTGNLPLKVSLELIQDSAFDIAGFIGDRLGERIGRKQAVDLATGAGGTEPVGLLSKSADTMTATVASLAASEHIFQVDSAYRDLGNCRFVMSDTSLVKFWQAQAAGLPIFIPGGASIGGAPHGTLYGYPITIDAAAGNLVAFGDIRRGYIIRRVRGVQVLVDPYTAQGTRQIAYHAWARMDANIQDSFAYSVSSYSGVSADT